MASHNSKSSFNIKVERAWRLAVNPPAIGALLLTSALIAIVGPFNALPDGPALSWWSTTFQADGMARGAASLFIMAAVLGAGLLLTRWQVQHGDVLDTLPDGLGAGKTTRLPALGAALMGLGVALGVMTWMVAQSQVAPTRVALPVGKTVESYHARTVNGAMRVMLPSRLKIKSVSADTGSAELELSKVGETGILQTIVVGEPVDIDGVRYALAGVEYNPQIVRALFSSRNADSVPAAANVGDTFRVTLDGPEFKVVQIARDYLNAMGPAVELESEATGKFWVFQRATPIDVFDSPHGLKLETLETAPVVLISISRGQPLQVFGAAGVLFLAGLALFLFSHDRVFGKSRKGEGAWSLNESHTLEEGPWKS